MLIYFSHSKTARGLYHALEHGNFENCEFVLPHKESDEPYPTKELFESGKCDLVLADVTYRATGQGIELGWASIMGVPIVCVHHYKSKPSRSLSLLTSVILPYTEFTEFTDVVKYAIASSDYSRK